MPTKTPFDPLPTKTAFPVVPPTKTPVRVEPPVMTVSPTERPVIPATPTAPHVRVDRAATPTASLSSTPVPTHRPASTATPLPSATVIITEPPTPVQTQTCPPQSSTSPTFIVISSPNSSAPVLGLASLLGLIGLALLYQHHIWVHTDLHLRRATLQLTRRTQLIIDDEWIITLLNQAVFDATGQDVGLDQIDRVLSDPAPVIVGLGRDFQRVIFTPAPAVVSALIPLLDGSPRRLHAYPVDARHGDLFIVDDLAAAYRHVCRQHHITQPLPARLARCDRWLIYLLPPPDSHSQRR
ncbi:MAG: hypothetical protein KA765_07845 [Thermoflexales bacterium]|nr:hypothetical protein [Thermoflexales bacterium]